MIYGNIVVPGKILVKHIAQPLRWIGHLVSQIDWSFDCCLCREPDANGALCSACQHLLVQNRLACRLCAQVSGSCETADLLTPPHTTAPGNSPQQQSGVWAGNDICEDCSLMMPQFAAALVPYVYRFPADQLVMQLKYHDSPGAARVMAQLMESALDEYLRHEANRVDYLVPVPLLPERFRQRGFNQSMQLARCLSKRFAIPVHSTALLRSGAAGATSHGLSHTALDREARLAGGASERSGFTADGVSGLRLLLVDDVMTTGATLCGAAESLLVAGAERVSVCAFARTPP